jgi:Fe-S cluster assembly protein SufD
MSPAPHPAPSALSPALRSFEAQWLARDFKRAADPLTSLREDAMKRVLRLGLPTTRDETWRYTNLRHLTSHGFVDAPTAARGAFEPTASLSLLSAAERAATVLMVNGHPILPTDIDTCINGIELSNLREVARIEPGLIAAYLEPLTDADQARWALLNTALFLDGLYLKITAKVETPLVILHLLTAEGADNVAHPRVIIDAAPGCSATIIEHYVEQGEHPPLCNSATHITAGRDSLIEHYRVFATSAGTEHIDSLNIRQNANSRCKQFTIALGGGLVRTTLEASLNEPGASLDSYSLLVGHEARHVDCVNVATHNSRDTRSRQTARAIASGTSRVVLPRPPALARRGDRYAAAAGNSRG